jgi:ribosomal protein L7Ae-like RNA K-turn-binding protein
MSDSKQQSSNTKVVKKGQPGVLAVTPQSTTSATSATTLEVRFKMPEKAAPNRSQFQFSNAKNQNGTKKKHIFTISGPNAVIDSNTFLEMQARKRPKKPNKLKLGILHDRIDYYADPARADDALAEWDRLAALRRAELMAVDQDIVDTHARVVDAQSTICAALRPFADFLSSPANHCAVVLVAAESDQTRPLVASLGTTLVAYRKHRKVLHKLLLLRDKTADVAAPPELEPLNVSLAVTSIQTPPVRESIEEMCMLRRSFSTAAVRWHLQLFDAYEAMIERLVESMRSAIKVVPDRVVVFVTAGDISTLIGALNECEVAYVAYAKKAVIFDRHIDEIGKMPAERADLVEKQRLRLAALQHGHQKLDNHLATLKAEKSEEKVDDVDNKIVDDDNADDNATDDNADNDDDAHDDGKDNSLDMPPLPEDFKALELALKSESVVAFYKKLRRLPPVEAAPLATYVNHDVSEELTSAVVAILGQLDRYQVRGKQTNAPRAKRLDIGMHATRKRLEARSAIAIVLATDIEPLPTLMKEIEELQKMALQRRVPVLCVMTRRDLATALNRQNAAGEKLVSVVTIVRALGAEPEIRALREMWRKARNKFVQKQREDVSH